MRLDVVILIGNGRGSYASARKTIALDFAPVPGMKYDDGTWRDSGGRAIIEVSIECPPDETPYLNVALKPDDSGAKDNLSPTYKANGWDIV